MSSLHTSSILFFFNDTATTEIYTLSLHDALPRVLVLNKADAIDDERRRELAFRHPDAVLVSALTGEGLDALGERIAAEFERTLRDVELLVPFSEGGTLSEIGRAHV